MQSGKVHDYKVVMIRCQDFNFDTISIQYFEKYCDIDSDIDIFSPSARSPRCVGRPA